MDEIKIKELWQSSKLSIDDFYIQLSREIAAGLLAIDTKDESRINRVIAVNRSKA